ncbi:hypothetical protein PAMP_017791 [Pampus punctatissimus]
MDAPSRDKVDAAVSTRSSLSSHEHRQDSARLLGRFQRLRMRKPKVIRMVFALILGCFIMVIFYFNSNPRPVASTASKLLSDVIHGFLMTGQGDPTCFPSDSCMFTELQEPSYTSPSDWIGSSLSHVSSASEPVGERSSGQKSRRSPLQALYDGDQLHPSSLLTVTGFVLHQTADTYC